ncbi:MAG: tetratricopeptide repeat protein [Bacteroidota bacterium]
MRISSFFLFLPCFLFNGLYAQSLPQADSLFDRVEYSSAKAYYLEHSDDLSPRQTSNLGFCFFVEENFAQAKAYFKQGIAKKDAHSYRYLGYMYEQGVGDIEKDIPKAIELYEQAGELKDGIALSNLGYLYFKGTGVKRDRNKGVEYYQLAAKLGNPRALNNLGDMYKTGDFLEKDLEKAYTLIKMAAEEGMCMGCQT